VTAYFFVLTVGLIAGASAPIIARVKSAAAVADHGHLYSAPY
jgi:hypothetical protein